ncbi:MAB_1171c family putative transporter [Streptomyces sp. NPDC006703]|uniref:MAB_1171c family putative transporter n=1 Tax=Streptomyces sp. NPDC006703 TaxID=3364759 RepID=UPI0036856CCB
MTDYLHPLCALTALLALTYKLRDLLRTPRDPALAVLCGVLALSALSLTLSQPAVWSLLDRLLGYPNIAALLAQCSVVLLITGQQVVLIYWNSPPRQARRKIGVRLALALLVLGTLVCLFTLLAPDQRKPRGFTLHYVHEPLYSAYLLLYIAAYVHGEIVVARLSRRYARLAPQPWLRRGLNLVCAGATLTLGYGTIRLLNIVTTRLPWKPDSLEWLAWLCGDAGTLLIHIGWTMPGWGPALTTAHRSLRAWRRFRRLRPLWEALSNAAPSIVLETAARPWRSRYSLQALEFRLYRRVIEIRDGQLALRAYAGPEAGRRAREHARTAGLDGADLRAAVEAALLATAIQAKETGRPPTLAPPHGEMPGTAGLADETDWLIKVAVAFQHSPVVTRTLTSGIVREHSRDCP